MGLKNAILFFFFLILLTGCFDLKKKPPWDDRINHQKTNFTTQFFQSYTSSLTMTSALALNPSGSKKGTAWLEITNLSYKPNTLNVLETAEAQFDLYVNINFNGCTVLLGMSNYFRLDVSRDGGATYTSYYSPQKIVYNSGNATQVHFDKVGLTKGDVLVYRLYTKLEEYELIGADPNNCITSVTYHGYLDLLIEDFGKLAVELPPTYEFDIASGFTLYDETFSWSGTNPSLSADHKPAGFLYGTPTVDVPVPRPLEDIQINTNGHIRITYAGTFNWTGCSFNTSTQVRPIFYPYIAYDIEATTPGIWHLGYSEADRSNQEEFVAAYRGRIGPGQRMRLTPKFKIAYTTNSPGIPTTCITNYTLTGRLKIENFPYVE